MFNILKKNQSNQIRDEIGQVVTEEFNNFLNSEKERLVFCVQEMPKEVADEYRRQIPSGWRTFEQGQHAYYPVAVLEDREVSSIVAEKEYQVVAFVKEKAFGVAPYEQAGVEIISRVRSNALLPKMVPESELNYSSIKDFFPGSNLQYFIDASVNAEYTPKELKEQIVSAEKYYEDNSTKFLDYSLHRLDKRNESADESIFREMRTNIANAEKSTTGYKN